MITKTKLRKQAKQTRNNTDIKVISLDIISRLKKLEMFKKSKNILTYSPLKGEINLNLINFKEEKNWIFPKIHEDNLEAYHVKTPSRLKLGAFNVFEPYECKEFNPNKIELAIIPALMVDGQGHRLGYGKGFYDRFIPNLNPNCSKIILIQDNLIIDKLPINEFDKEADFILSEKRFIKI